MNHFYSLIIPVFNRPDHIESLLKCLVLQKYTYFEVLIVESGSKIKSDQIAEAFRDQLEITYIPAGNNGQGFSRNEGMKRAKGDYFVILDSDILVPEDYLQNIEDYLAQHDLDAFGGPDKLHPDSSTFQKAVNFCMTSLLTTGGTRGKKTKVGKYYPRSFNMGVSREVYKKVGGFQIPFMGEDLEWSHRIIKAGFKTGLIENAFVFHERKKDLKGFYKQINFFGKARINVSTLVENSFKPLYLLPFAYVGYLVLLLVLLLVAPLSFNVLIWPLLIYNALILITAGWSLKNFWSGCYAILCVNALMMGYSKGMLTEFFNLYIFKNKQSYQL